MKSLPMCRCILNMNGLQNILEGVIVSTDEYHYLAWKRLADEAGVSAGGKASGDSSGAMYSSGRFGGWN